MVVDLVVTVKPGSDLDAISAQLAQAGLQVHEKFAMINSITGSAQETDIARVRGIQGVLDVTKNVPIQLNPPGTPR
jgi:hypothetical protein